jgi:hypothetical protein
MKNINYDLIKTLHMKLDMVWRFEQYYVNDAKEAKCHSVAALEQMLADEKRHVEALKKEIEARIQAGMFD